MRPHLAAAAGLLVCLVLGGAPARADDARPLGLTIRETSPPDGFHVRFQTPMRGNARLRVQPKLPPGAVAVEGSLERRIAGDSLIEEFDVLLEGGLVNRPLGIEGLGLIARNALLTVHLEDGRVLRAVLGGTRQVYEVPPASPLEQEPWTRGVAREAGEGIRHGLLRPAHLLFAVAIALAGGPWMLALGLFLLGALLGTFLGPLPALSPALADALLALVAGLAAREALLGRTRHLAWLAAAAGIVHGLADASWTHAVGLDLAHLTVGAAALLLLRAIPRLRRPAGWSLGVLALALSAGLAVQASPSRAASPRTPVPMPIALGALLAAPTPARGLVTDVEAYLDVGVFETRLEILGRLDALAAWVATDVPAGDVLSVETQSGLLERFARAVEDRVAVVVDGARPEIARTRRGFATQEATGTYLRDVPVPEKTAEALVGLTFAYDTPSIPNRVEARLVSFPPGLEALRARVIDPEVSRDVLLGKDALALVWTNELQEDPLPPVRSVAVRQAPVPVPVASVGLVILASLVGAWLWHRGRARGAGVLLRVSLAIALLIAPWLPVDASAWAKTAGPVRTDAEVRAVTATLLDNVYRAFNVRQESGVYDRLALSLAHEVREEAYLEFRRTLAFERVGGARTHVDAVELRDLEDTTPLDDGGFETTARWTVSGSVTHFGHRHLRTNLYRARLTVRPAEDRWLVTALEVEDLVRQR